MRTDTTAEKSGQTTGAGTGQRSRRAQSAGGKSAGGNGAASGTGTHGQDASGSTGNAPGPTVARPPMPGKPPAVYASQSPFLVPSYPANWTYAQKLEAEIIRAANLGKRLKIAGAPVMQGCPDDATREETALHLQQAQNAALEIAAAALLVA